MTRLCSVRLWFFGLTPLFAVSGCDSDWAKRLDTGTVVPDFRIEVHLSRPAEMQELYKSFLRVSEAIGFPEYVSRPVVDPTFLTDPQTHRVFTWVESDHGDDDGRHKISLSWDSTDKLDSFLLIFYNDSVDDFGEEEWRYYKQVRYDILPTIYPDADFVTLKHPSEYTPSELSERLASQMGIDRRHPPSE